MYEHGFDQVGVGYKERLESIGFDIVSYQQQGPITPNLGQSTLADIAAKYNIQITILSITVEAQKPRVTPEKP